MRRRSDAAIGPGPGQRAGNFGKRRTLRGSGAMPIIAIQVLVRT